MQFLILARARPEAFKNGVPADFAEVAAQDAAHAQKAYLGGVLRQMWTRDPGHGPVAIVELASVEDARALFGAWPLFKIGYMEMDVFALNPYPGFGAANAASEGNR
jgi:muconolactone delta-isomerase